MLSTYAFEGQNVRVIVDEQGEPHFVGKDVCDVLGYANGADAISRHCKGVVKRYPLMTTGGQQELRVLSEPDVLRLVINCALPAGDRFERLVFEEILPTIRRTGSYSLITPPNFAAALRLAADQAEEIAAQREQLQLAAPAVDFVAKFVDSTGLKGFRQVCKLLNANEAEFRLFLESKKIMYKLGGEWTPHAQHLDTGRFSVKAGTSEVSGHAFNSARFTAKGVNWVAGEWAKHKLESQMEVAL